MSIAEIIVRIVEIKTGVKIDLKDISANQQLGKRRIMPML